MSRLPSLLATLLAMVLSVVFVPAAIGQAGQSLDDQQKLEEVSKNLDRQIDRYVKWLTRMYRLSNQQQQQVRQRLQELKQEHLEYGPKIAESIENLREEVQFYVSQARKGQQIDREKMRDLQKRLIALAEKAPLNWRNVIREVEKQLPPDQVKQGRKRRRNFQERMREWKERQKRLNPGSVPMPTDVLKPYIEPTVPYEEQAARETARSSGARRGAGERPPRVVRPRPRRSAQPQPAVRGPVPLDDWTRYVQEFINTYNLDLKQQKQAWQVLSELKKRAEEYRLSHKPDYDAAGRISDAKLRAEEIQLLDKPIVQLFEELKNRLERIPTAAQREAAKQAKPAKKAAPPKAPATAPATQEAPAEK